MKDILVVHGPNLNLLGERNTDVYGKKTLGEIDKMLKKFASENELELKVFQSNHEGKLIDIIHKNRNRVNGMVINPGALTHYSYALRDAVEAVDPPAVEVHISDIQVREDFRKTSVLEQVCVKQISGGGPESYVEALKYLLEKNFTSEPVSS